MVVGFHCLSPYQMLGYWEKRIAHLWSAWPQAVCVSNHSKPVQAQMARNSKAAISVTITSSQCRSFLIANPFTLCWLKVRP
ncbi:hypothetical protein LCGC14_1796220 [marine sediment metagenome]|uniref:Uncharacterized protein n=1 Tax=marine sediment metagenome TaxID=412755 RepID=A0A0F9GR86_9ZZZZ